MKHKTKIDYWKKELRNLEREIEQTDSALRKLMSTHLQLAHCIQDLELGDGKDITVDDFGNYKLLEDDNEI